MEAAGSTAWVEMKDGGPEEGIFQAEGTAWSRYGEEFCVMETRLENEESEEIRLSTEVGSGVSSPFLSRGCIYCKSAQFFEGSTPSHGPGAIKAHLLP